MLRFLFTCLFSGAMNLVWAQPTYNACNQALELCPNQVVHLTTKEATPITCPGCEDDISACFTPGGTVWVVFQTTEVGGALNLNFSNLSFVSSPNTGNTISAVVYQANVPCSSGSYVQKGTCFTGKNASFTIPLTGLLPKTTYYILISGDKSTPSQLPANCSFDLEMNGSAVSRPQPALTVSGSLQVCLGSPLVLTAHVATCPDQQNFKWYVNQELVAITTDSIFTSTAIKNGDVIQVETACYSSCPITITSSTVQVTVKSFAIDAGTDTTITKGSTLQLNGQVVADSLYWFPAFEMNNNTTLKPLVTPSETTIFTLMARSNGCWLSDQVTVSVKYEVRIPEIFTPNEDGINDDWRIEGLENYPDATLLIKDRWGQTVYQVAGYSDQKRWKGDEVPEGVYFYYLELRDENKTAFKGTITVLR